VVPPFLLYQLFGDSMKQPDETLIAFGGPVKVLRRTKTHATVGGFLVRFTSPDDHDLEQEFFNDTTDYGAAKSVGLYYHHGQDPVVGKRRFGSGEVSVKEEGDEVGLWMESQIELSDAYAEAVLELVERGKLGYSSGAVGHLVDRKAMKNAKGQAVNHITQWPIGEGSLTPTPAEPRNLVALKSLKSAVQPLTADIGGKLAKYSISAQADHIRQAFYAAFGGFNQNAWTADVMDDAVIGYIGDKYFRIPYTGGQPDGDTFTDVAFATRDDWQEVERRETWEAKRLQAQRAGHDINLNINIRTDSNGPGSVHSPTPDPNAEAADSSRKATPEADILEAGAAEADAHPATETAAKHTARGDGDTQPTTSTQTRDTIMSDKTKTAADGSRDAQDAAASEQNASKAQDAPMSRADFDQFKEEIKAMFKPGGKTVKPTRDVDTGAANLNLETGRGDSLNKAVAHWYRTGDVGGVKHLQTEESPDGQPIITLGADPGTNQESKAWKASNDTDMNIGTEADGGHLVPEGHFNRIIARRDEMMLADRLGVRNVPGVGTTVHVPLDAEADGEFVSTNEAVDSDRDAPAIGNKALTLVVYSKYLDLSYELLRDNDSNLLEFIEEWAGRGQAKTHNDLLITEVGTNGTSLKTFAAVAAIADGELEDIEGNDDLGAYLDDSNSVAWVMRNSTLAAIRKLRANFRIYGDQGSGGPGAGSGRELLEYPVHRSNKAAAMGASAKSVYFGNWFYVGMRNPDGVQFLRDPYSVAVKRQIRLHYYFSAVYGVLQAEAIGYGVHAAT